MLVPQYWAEGRAAVRERGRRATVRRFGWSDASQAEAQADADRRAQEALARLLAGEEVRRRDPKVPYNGAQGVPIREEIVARHGGTVETRNSYGARCLNTPNVLFVDIDLFARGGPGFALAVTVSVAAAAGFAARSLTGSVWAAAGAILLSLSLAPRTVSLSRNLLDRTGGGPAGRARGRIRRFAAARPEWNLRIYGTPAGLRLLATHRTFEPGEPEVLECFRLLGADPLYVRMCNHQKCFRARVSPKPWRIGIAEPMKPRAVWPLPPAAIPRRRAWIERYEAASLGHAACALLGSVGSGVVHPDVRAVVELHDELSRATRDLPLA